jgi:hypothetical protein
MSLIDSKGEYFIKQATGILDFLIDWVDFLGTDTISTSTWTVPTGITKVSDSKTTTTTTVWLSGGTAGIEYELICTIVTVGGRTEPRALRVKVIPPVLVSTDLITLDYFKQVMGRQTTDPDTDAENDPFVSLINAASTEIREITGRQFTLATYTEQFTVDGQNYLQLTERPLVYVDGLYSATSDALLLTNTAANALSAWAWVRGGHLNLRIKGGASNGIVDIDLAATDADTLTELVAKIIAAGSSWSASLATGRTGYEPSDDLVERSPIKVGSIASSIQMLDPSSQQVDYSIDYPAATLVFNLRYLSTVWVKYRGGYSTIPDALKLLTARLALHLYDLNKTNMTIGQERIGDYYYTRDPALMAIFDQQLAGWKARRL